MFCDYGQVAERAAWQVPFYFVSGLGHQAVMVFFVLSGFFVGGSVLRSRQAFGWRSYSVARLSRLWTVLLPALVFTALADYAIGVIWPEVFVGDGYFFRWASGPREEYYSADALTFLGNLFFLQTVEATVFGSNGPLWSLANEFWYYVIFPLIIAVAYPRFRPASILYGLAAIGLLLWLPRNLILDGLIWLFGAIVYCVRDRASFRNKLSQVLASVTSGGLFAASLVNSKYDLVSRVMPVDSDLLVGIAFAVFAWQLIAVRSPNTQWLRVFVRWLSDISYTLYLFHFPVTIAVGAYLAGAEPLQPTVGNLFFYSLLMLVILLLSHVAWFAFERNTNWVRGWMKSAVGLSAKPPESST